MRAPFCSTTSTLSLSCKRWAAALAVVVAATAASAQVNIDAEQINFRSSGYEYETTRHYGELELDADADYTGTVIDATNTSTSAAHGIAVRGTSEPQANYGTGGYFKGGCVGLQGCATASGTGYRYGGYFYASGGSYANYGIVAYKSGGGYAGYFNSSIYVAGTTYPSDAKLKLNEKSVENALSKLMQLKPKTYEYDTLAYRSLSLPAGRQTGFVAQDVEKVLPELVDEVIPPPVPGDTLAPEPFKGLNYTGLIPVLVAAIQEQQATITEQNRRIEQLEKAVAK